MIFVTVGLVYAGLLLVGWALCRAAAVADAMDAAARDARLDAEIAALLGAS